MLITKAQIEKACNLNLVEINDAMLAGGYTDKYTAAKFLGMNSSGQFVYEVSGWDNIEGEMVTGKVYLKFVRGALAQGFYLAGDY